MNTEENKLEHGNEGPALTNMTTGNPFKCILFFALPLMIGSACQQIYTMTDAAVVGKVLGVVALSALGACDLLVWTVASAIQAYTEGFSIRMAHSYGAGDMQKLHRTVATSARLAVIAGIALCAGLEIAAPVILQIMRVQKSVYPYALLYLRIIFAGLPFVTAYNYFFAILRALGNSRTPLNAMLITAGLNIVLDIVFVVFLRLGIGGAAFATIFSQFVSAVYSFLSVRKLLPSDRSGLKYDGALVGNLLRLSIPMALQLIFCALGGLVIQSVVNTYAIPFIAGYAAVYKVYGLLEFASISYCYAITTYTSQNLGAGNMKRIRRGVFYGELLAAATAVLFILLIAVGSRFIVSLFISGNPDEVEEAIKYGCDFLYVMAFGMPMLNINHVSKGWVQGLGYAGFSTVNSILECLARAGSALFLGGIFGYRCVFVAEPIAWSVGAVIHTASGIYYTHKRGKELNT